MESDLRIIQQLRKEVRDFVNLHADVAHGTRGRIQQLYCAQCPAGLDRHSELGRVQRLSRNIADISWSVMQ